MPSTGRPSGDVRQYPAPLPDRGGPGPSASSVPGPYKMNGDAMHKKVRQL